MSKITSQPARGKKILDQVSDAIRLKHDSYHTVQELLGHKEVKSSLDTCIMFPTYRLPIPSP